MDLAAIIKQALHQDQTARVTQKNALQPFLWLCAVSVPTFLAFGTFVPAYSGFSFGIAAVIALTSLAVAVGFAIWDRDRLHSEDFQLKSKSLDIIEAKGGPILNPKDLAMVSGQRAAFPRREKT